MLFVSAINIYFTFVSVGSVLPGSTFPQKPFFILARWGIELNWSSIFRRWIVHVIKFVLLFLMFNVPNKVVLMQILCPVIRMILACAWIIFICIMHPIMRLLWEFYPKQRDLRVHLLSHSVKVAYKMHLLASIRSLRWKLTSVILKT